MATTSDIKNGLCIEMNGDLLSVVEFLHVKPGKGNTFVRTKLKSFKTGRTLEHSFLAGTKIEVARIERRPYTFLYKDDSGYNFMHAEDFEQISIQEEIINAPQFLKEGQYVEMIVHADTETPLSCELPAFVDMEITYTEPGVKGNTATNATKEATVETGAKIRVPLFIETGERIKVDTRTAEYSERIK
ncbi:Elongation factor P [bioreactor metagenome]|uniref:Elongation factor P n=1 Tax=bioreactor metagenome TaxID=1076179 RepID=A0A644U251_9ZZZZ|nr:elongation factor P [Bacteroidales bacterium]MDY4790383.1 elongation factor P [Bacteroidales bacterium]